jgi:acetolactate synthase-1/2/3 large subunit
MPLIEFASWKILDGCAEVQTAKINGARFIAETFKCYGVTHVFYMPAILPSAMSEMRRLNIDCILTHCEKAAAYMADGYARASHRPGICMAQSVGAANLAAGLQDAYLASSPVIAITGHRPSSDRRRNAYQEIDHHPLFEPVTKFNAKVDSLEELPFFIHQAFREATSGNPGPVHLDTLGARGEVVINAEAKLEVKAEGQFSYCPAIRPIPDPEYVKEAIKIIEDAKRPVIIAGGGATISQAGKEIVELAEMLSIPVATSLAGKGVIPDSHPLSIGVVGTYSRSCTNRIVSEADLVIYIGSRTGSLVTHEWRIPRPGTPVIQIDINPSELGRNYPTKVAIWGDAKITVQQLIELAQPRSNRDEWHEKFCQLVYEWREKTESLRNADSSPIRPERLCRDLTNFLPSDVVLVADTGYAGGWTGTLIDLKYPDQSYIRASGSLGWGFPGSLGVKCALPDRPIICFTGDGGFWYHLAELETAMRYGINTITVVNNNNALKQTSPYYKNQDNNSEFWHFSDVNFALIAQTIGCFGIRVEKPEDIKGALTKALNSDKPAVIDVATDIDATLPVPWG